ncbi:Uncharacterized protein HA466_0252270 [Hirschfeldia incana]|nr:Uncharacterized protein HA466_0252270 [Hirschfeldia incana]
MTVTVPKKRKNSGEETLPEKKRPKKTKFAEPVDAEAITRAKSTKPEKSITALIRLRETKTDSTVTRLIREKTTSRVGHHDTNTNPRVTKGKPKKQSVTALIRLRETKANSKVTRLIHENTAWRIEKQNHGFKDLIAKAREKLQEKRQFGDRNSDIASQRIAARLALDQMVETDDDFNDHLKYHTELQNLGCDFIRDQVSCLKMFSLLSRSDYESN